MTMSMDLEEYEKEVKYNYLKASDNFVKSLIGKNEFNREVTLSIGFNVVFDKIATRAYEASEY